MSTLEPASESLTRPISNPRHALSVQKIPKQTKSDDDEVVLAPNPCYRSLFRPKKPMELFVLSNGDNPQIAINENP